MTAPAITNVALAVADMATLRPSAQAVLFPQRRGGYSSLTFAELHARTDAVASSLEAIGLRRGVRTVLMVKPSLEFFVLTFALFKLGAVPVLIDPGMGVRNLGRCLAEAEPEAFIGISKAHAARIALGWGRRSLRIFVTVGRRWFWGGHTYVGMEQNGNRYSIADTQADDTAAILFTSGSTGPAKGAVYTHGMFAAQVRLIRETYGIEPGEVDLCTFPLFALFAPTLGMTAVIPDMDATRPARVKPANIAGPIHQFGVTDMFGSPALLRRVATDGGLAPGSLSSLRRVISAGAPVPADVLERFTKLLAPGTQVFTPYGATEAMPVCSIGSDEILGETRQRTAEGAGVCVGRPVSSMHVAIIRISDSPIEKWSDDLSLPVGEIGEIVVRGPVVSPAYFHRPEATAQAKIAGQEDGTFYHRTGDLGYFDDRGRLWFCGRKAHRVVTATGTLFTIPCEGVFNTHLKVFRTALVGVGEAGKQIPVLCVELKEAGGEENIRRELLTLGAARPHTVGIQTILFHPKFPVDIRHNSKIFREKLAVWADSKVPR
jgi:acyl-CoA synthetase (AMP-forming)/AMP-acid ligase II